MKKNSRNETEMKQLNVERVRQKTGNTNKQIY